MSGETLVIKNRNLCSGNGSQLPGHSRNSKCSLIEILVKIDQSL